MSPPKDDYYQKRAFSIVCNHPVFPRFLCYSSVFTFTVYGVYDIWRLPSIHTIRPFNLPCYYQPPALNPQSRLYPEQISALWQPFQINVQLVIAGWQFSEYLLPEQAPLWAEKL